VQTGGGLLRLRGLGNWKTQPTVTRQCRFQTTDDSLLAEIYLFG
jgi:hypothetical protein